MGLNFLVQVSSAVLKSWIAATYELFMKHMTSAYEASVFSFTLLCILKAWFYKEHAEFAKSEAMSWRPFQPSTLSTLVSVLLF